MPVYVETDLTYTLKLQQRDFGLLIRCLGVLLKIPGVTLKPEDIESITELNRQLLDIRVKKLREALGRAEGAVSKAKDAE